MDVIEQLYTQCELNDCTPGAEYLASEQTLPDLVEYCNQIHELLKDIEGAPDDDADFVFFATSVNTNRSIKEFSSFLADLVPDRTNDAEQLFLTSLQCEDKNIAKYFPPHNMPGSEEEVMSVYDAFSRAFVLYHFARFTDTVTALNNKFKLKVTEDLLQIIPPVMKKIDDLSKKVKA